MIVKLSILIDIKNGRAMHAPTNFYFLMFNISLASKSNITHKFANVSKLGIDFPLKYLAMLGCLTFNLFAISVCVNPLSFIASTNLFLISSNVIIIPPLLLIIKNFITNGYKKLDLYPMVMILLIYCRGVQCVPAKKEQQ